MKKNTNKIIFLIVSILFVAGLGSLFVYLGNDWFNSLTKPSQWIPSFVIPIVWSIIYISFAVLLSIWLSKENLSASTFALLITNGVLNVLWCLIFFALKQTFLGNIFIVLNLIAGFLLIWDIYKQKKYGLFLLIYPIWLSIATTLNLAVWILN